MEIVAGALCDQAILFSVCRGICKFVKCNNYNSLGLRSPPIVSTHQGHTDRARGRDISWVQEGHTSYWCRRFWIGDVIGRETPQDDRRLMLGRLSHTQSKLEQQVRDSTDDSCIPDRWTDKQTKNIFGSRELKRTNSSQRNPKREAQWKRFTKL